jgi:hypothetical protein
MSGDLISRLRPISGFEEELIAARADQRNTAALCNEVLARCLVPPGADPARASAEIDALSVAERDQALVALRRRSFGDRVQCEVTCPACQAVNEVDFDLAALPVPGAPERRSVQVERDGLRAAARLPTAADQAALIGGGGTAAERRTALLARVLERLGDEHGPFDADAVRGLPSAVRLAIEEALEAEMPDLDLAMEVSCAACGAGFSAPLELVDFFFSELTRHAGALLREVHRLAREYHWAEQEILALPWPRRRAYLSLIEADHDAALIAGAA